MNSIILLDVCIHPDVAYLRIVRKHDANFDTDNTLPHHDVPDGSVSVHLSGVTSFDHVPVPELHALGTLSPQFTGDHDFHTLGGCLHHKPHNTVASPPDGESTEKLELERLSLSLRAKAAVLNALGVKLDGTIIEVEPLLDDGGQLADALSLLSENVLRACGTDDDFGAMRGGADLDTGITVLSEFTGEELVELGVKDTISDELALGGELGA